MALARHTAADDPLFRMADQVPLCRHLGLVATTDEMPSEPNVRPFGLHFATTAVTPIPVDLSGLRYDRRHQITVDDIGAPVFGKHSTVRRIPVPPTATRAWTPTPTIPRTKPCATSRRCSF